MTNYDNETGGDRGDGDGGQVNPELRDAKIECTTDIFGQVLNQLDEEIAKLKLITKF
jgi:hypothetical protein